MGDQAHRALTDAAYSVREAGAYLDIPYSTLISWVVGRKYPSQHGRRKRAFDPVIRIADPAGRLLSFQNLVEAYVLNALRRTYRVKLDRVRTAVDRLEKRFKTLHPLSDRRILTDRRDLYIEAFGEFENVSSDQIQLPILNQYLERVERSPTGVPIRIFPVTRSDVAQSPSKIVIDPTRRFGRPYVLEAGVETSAIAERFLAGDSLMDLSREFRCSVEAIEEAIRYERAAV